MTRRHIPPYYHRETGTTIDISPRQSGKTERLIEEAMHHVVMHREENRPVSFIVAPNHDMVVRLRDRLYHKLNGGGVNRNYFHVVAAPRIADMRSIQNYARANSDGHTEFFFDEFEFMDEVPFIRNSYYSSSPNKRWEQSHTHRIVNIIDHDRYHGGGMSAERAHRLFERYVNSGERPPRLSDDMLGFDVERTQVQARRRQLEGTWTLEPFDDLQNLHGLDVENELVDSIVEEIQGRPVERTEQSDEDAWLDRLGI